MSSTKRPAREACDFATTYGRQARGDLPVSQSLAGRASQGARIAAVGSGQWLSWGICKCGASFGRAVAGALTCILHDLLLLTEDSG